MQTSPLLLFCNSIFNLFCNFFYNVCRRSIPHFSHFLLASPGAAGILGGNRSPPTLVTQLLEKGGKRPLNMQYLLQGVDVFFFSEMTTDIVLEIG